MTAGEGFGLRRVPAGDPAGLARELAERAALAAPKPLAPAMPEGHPDRAGAMPGAPARPEQVIRPQKQAPPPRRTTAPRGSSAR